MDISHNHITPCSRMHMQGKYKSVQSIKCLKEVNRLRQEYRTDLPLYDVSVSSAATKRKLRALSDTNEPPAKGSIQPKRQALV